MSLGEREGRGWNVKQIKPEVLKKEKSGVSITFQEEEKKKKKKGEKTCSQK